MFASNVRLITQIVIATIIYTLHTFYFGTNV